MIKRLNVNIRSAIDLLIAQIALENDLILLHNDDDFENIAVLQPLKEKIKVTDNLIDQIVYKLYGLTGPITSRNFCWPVKDTVPNPPETA